MTCPYAEICGGCLRRGMSEEQYRETKTAAFRRILSGIKADFAFGEPVFVADGTRRRAAMAFRRRKGKVTLGFNEAASGNVVDCETCALLTPKLNAALPDVRRLLTEVCALPFTERKKGRKTVPVFLDGGDVWLCEADNGTDVVLEFDRPLELGHRMAVFELAQGFEGIIRISHRRRPDAEAEPVVEKNAPYVKIADTFVYIPAGTFLQPSREGEQALVSLVLKYLGETSGRIADLFCGVGTFSYPLARNPANRVLAVDSSERLLAGFRRTVNKNMIPNIEIAAKNLFKYPLDATELKGFNAVVFDPPRAGAAAQTARLAALPVGERPEKIIAVSCNPGTFVNDANTLVSAGYKLVEVTMVDQFVYSDHSELVALFTK